MTAELPRPGRISLAALTTVAGFIILGNVFVHCFMARENYIYYWDFSSHWVRTVALTETFPAHPVRAVREVIYGIRHFDYNDFGALLLLPAAMLFGTSRAVFVHGTFNALAVPALIAGLVLFRKAFRLLQPGSGPAFVCIPAFVTLTLPMFWTPILRGYVGVGGLIVVHLVLLAYLCGPLDIRRPALVIALGALLCLLVLFRKWFAYWVVALFAALAVDALLFVPPWGRTRREFWSYGMGITLMGVVAGGLFFTLALPLALFILRTDYSDIFAYNARSGSPWAALIPLWRYVGPLHTVAFAGAFVYLLCRAGTRRLAVFLLVQLSVSFVLFTNTQDFGTHHYYLLLAPLVLAASLAIGDFLLRLGSLTARWATGSGLAVTAVFVLLAFFFPAWRTPRERLAGLLPASTHYPMIRHDMQEIDRLLSTLARLLQDPDERVYVLASSPVLNGDVVKYAHLSLGRKRSVEGQILFTHGIDRWHGFPSNMLSARYVVVGAPVQIHARPEFQRVVSVPAEALLEARYIGTSYERLPYEFALDEGVKVYVYERVRPFREADLDALSDIMREHYPDRPRLYEFNCPPELIAAGPRDDPPNHPID